VYRDVNCEGWKSDIHVELDNFRDMEVWVKVDRSIGRNVMSNKWVFDIKHDAEGNVDKVKTHLTCREFTEVKGEDYEETWARRSVYTFSTCF
jgi:hypothetical protein